MIRKLTDSDLSKLTRSLPCGDATFQRKFALEYLLISDYEYKKHKHDQGPYCEEIVYECLLTWKKTLEENGEVATNQQLFNILDEVRINEGLVKEEDFKYLNESLDLGFHEKLKGFKRWFKKFLKTQSLFIFILLSIFVLSYFELIFTMNIQVSFCFLSVCLLVKLFKDGEILMVRIFRKDQEREFQQDEKEFQQDEKEFQQDDKEFQQTEAEQVKKISSNFTFQVSGIPLNCDIEERLDQFTKLKMFRKKKTGKSFGAAKEDRSDFASSIPHIEFKCVMKKRENDILLEIYDLTDMRRIFDTQDFINQKEIRDTLAAAFIGGGIIRLSGFFVTKNEEKVSTTAEFYMSPWDIKLQCMVFWASRYFVLYTSVIKFENYEDGYEIQIEGFTTAKDGNIPNESSSNNAKIVKFVLCPISLLNLYTAYRKSQPSYEILELLCLEAFSCNDPQKMKRILRHKLISSESKLDQNSGRHQGRGMNPKITDKTSSSAVPAKSLKNKYKNPRPLKTKKERSREVGRSDNVLCPVSRNELPSTAYYPICYNAVSYNVSAPVPARSYLGLN